MVSNINTGIPCHDPCSCTRLLSTPESDTAKNIIATPNNNNLQDLLHHQAPTVSKASARPLRDIPAGLRIFINLFL